MNDHRILPNLVLRTVAASLILTILDFLFDLVAPVADLEFASILVSHLVFAIAIAVYSINLGLEGRNAYGVVFAVAFVIGGVNILIEAWVFNVTDTIETMTALLRAALSFGVLTVIMFLGRSATSNNVHVPFRIGRAMATSFLYILFYVAAGMILQATVPRITEFYQGKLPAIDVILITQVFRGMIFTAVAYLIVRSSAATRMQRALMAGMIFSICGGIAPLIASNPYMPLDIRVAHSVEVGISNFLYGWLSGLILIPKEQRSASGTSAPSAVTTNA